MAGKERLFLPMRWFCADVGVTGFLDNGPTRRRNCFSDTSCLGCGVIEMAARASGAVSQMRHYAPGVSAWTPREFQKHRRKGRQDCWCLHSAWELEAPCTAVVQKRRGLVGGHRVLVGSSLGYTSIIL